MLNLLIHRKACSYLRADMPLSTHRGSDRYSARKCTEREQGILIVPLNKPGINVVCPVHFQQSSFPFRQIVGPIHQQDRLVDVARRREAVCSRQRANTQTKGRPGLGRAFPGHDVLHDFISTLFFDTEDEMMCGTRSAGIPEFRMAGRIAAKVLYCSRQALQDERLPLPRRAANKSRAQLSRPPRPEQHIHVLSNQWI